MASKSRKIMTRHLKDLFALVRFDKKQAPTFRYVSTTKKGEFTLEAVSDGSILKAAEGGARGAHIISRRFC